MVMIQKCKKFGVCNDCGVIHSDETPVWENIYNGTWMEYDDAVSRLHVVIAYCYGNSSNAA